MLPTAGVPFLTHLITRIREAGITHVVLGTSYQAEVFERHFGNGEQFGVELDYVVETEALGTGGGIRNVADVLRGDTQLIFNGDNLIGVDLQAMLATHRDAQRRRHAVPAPRRRRQGLRLRADRRAGPRHRVPREGADPVTDQINAGLYAFRREVIDSIPTGRPVSVEKETFPGLLAAGALVVGHRDDGYWRDFGTPADFVQGSADLVRGIAESPAVAEPGERLLLPGAEVHASATVENGSTIGRDAFVGSGALVDASVVFDRAFIAQGAVVIRSVIGAGAIIGRGAVIEDAVIGDEASIGDRVELRHGARVWPEVEIPDVGIRFSSDL